MDIKDEVRDTKDGVRDPVLGVAEGDAQNGGNRGPQNGVKAEKVPFVITPEMREKFTRDQMFRKSSVNSPSLRV